MEFKNKTVIITGGASGMGLALGKSFYEQGANVVLVDINKESLDKINADMPNALCLKADIRFFEEVKNTVDKAVEKFGTVDFMVNMAGGYSPRLLNEPPLDFCDRDIENIKWGLDLNLMAPVYYCHQVMRVMKKQNCGVIINIGSITGLEGSPTGSDYAISKTGVMYGLTKSMAILGAKYGVRCCCVSPGPVMTRPGMSAMKTLVGYPAQPSELVDMIMFLCSDKAKSITGTNYMVDGGRSILPRD